MTLKRPKGPAGTLVVLEHGSKILKGQFCGSTSLGSGQDPAIHFGLGNDNQPVQLDLYWPSGIHQVVQAPAVDQLINVVETP